MSVDSNTSLDPRIQIELEKLNSATDSINKYEIELDELKKTYQLLIEEAKEKFKQASHKITNAIEIAQPYYQARLYSQQLSKEVQIISANYDKAKTHLSAAKEMVFLAEQGLGEKSTLDMACQEMLSHATTRVNQCTNECTDVKNNLKISELKLEVANNRVMKLQNQLKSAIKVSRPYYETRANYNGLLKSHKKQMTELEEKITEVKSMYNEALRNLEEISESIHKLREEQIVRDKEMAAATIDHEEIKEPNTSFNTYLRYQNSLSDENDFEMDYLDTNTDTTDLKEGSPCETEYWSEIRLSHSSSTSSSYSHNIIEDKSINTNEESDSNDDNQKTVSKPIEIENKEDKKYGGISDWISKSSLRSTGRRQSFEMLLDTGDKVKDVFAQSFSRIGIGGTKLERRSSESEVSTTESPSKEFFIFNRNDKKDVLSDEQVENLLLHDHHVCSELAIK